jgi:probable rRNA maturation factor
LLRALGQPDSALSIVFVSAQEMRGLNQKYRGKDYATDVLSFSYTGEIIGNTPLLGEIIISPEIAYRNAARYRTSLERELRKLLAHGMLHLLGYDHEVDRGLMNRLQAKLMRRRLFINTPPLES